MSDPILINQYTKTVRQLENKLQRQLETVKATETMLAIVRDLLAKEQSKK